MIKKIAYLFLLVGVTLISVSHGSNIPSLFKPPGEIFAFTGPTCPPGSIAADGSSVLRTAYPNLYAAWGSSPIWGFADGTHMNLPNAKGMFLRGAGSQTVSGVSYSATLAATTQDQFQGHHHSTSAVTSAGGSFFGSGFNAQTGTVGDPITDGVNGTPRVGTETRPVNIAVLYCIKY